MFKKLALSLIKLGLQQALAAVSKLQDPALASTAEATSKPTQLTWQPTIALRNFTDCKLKVRIVFVQDENTVQGNKDDFNILVANQDNATQLCSFSATITDDIGTTMSLPGGTLIAIVQATSLPKNTQDVTKDQIWTGILTPGQQSGDNPSFTYRQQVNPGVGQTIFSSDAAIVLSSAQNGTNPIPWLIKKVIDDDGQFVGFYISASTISGASCSANWELALTPVDMAEAAKYNWNPWQSIGSASTASTYLTNLQTTLAQMTQDASQTTSEALLL